MSAPTGTSGTFGNVGEWPDPIPLIPESPAPLPIDVLPDWFRAHVVSVSNALQVPTDLALALGLAALSTACANKARTHVRPGWEEATHVWTACILPPASRKSPAFGKMIGPILAHEAEQIQDAQPGCDRRLVVSDITSERLTEIMGDNGGRISLLAPEGDIFRIITGRYSDGTPSIDAYKRAWTGDEPIRDDRITRDAVAVSRPALTIGLALQPDLLERLRNVGTLRGEGLLARFLWTIPESTVGYRLTGADVPPLDEDAASKYATRLKAMLLAESAGVEGRELVPHRLELTEEARESLYAFEAEVEVELRDGGRMASIADWGGKLVGQAVRLAALLHAAARIGVDANPWSAPIEDAAMQGGVALARGFVPHALTVFDQLEIDARMRLARYVLRRLQQAEVPLAKRELWHMAKGKAAINRVNDLDEALQILDDHHHIRIEQRPSDGGRPPSPWVHLNPRSAGRDRLERTRSTRSRRQPEGETCSP